MTFFPDIQTFLTLGPLRITWYAIFVLSGAFVAYALSLRQFRKWGYKDEVFENFFLMMLPIAIIGARIYYVIFEWQTYAYDPITIFYIWNGGLAIHGGIISATIFGYFYFKRHAIDGLRVADVIFPSLMIAQAIGRWGNFMNQEAYGQIVSEGFYRYFPSFIKNHMFIDGAYRQPTFLFESVGNIIGFVLIYFVYKKFGRKKRGDLAWAYITWYGMVRFIVEGMRTDSLMIGNFRMAQIISLIGVVIGVLGIFGVWNSLFKNMYPFKKEKPVILFDLDGTLVDTKDFIFAAFTKTFHKFLPQHELSQNELQSFLGPTLRQSYGKYFSGEQLDEVIAFHRTWESQDSHQSNVIKEIPHVRETLQFLKDQQYDIGVVSNKRAEMVRMNLKQFSLDSYIEVIVGSEDVDIAKPNPMGLMKACELLHRSHDDMVYVGDTPSDIKTCKNMGAYSVAFVMDEHRAKEMIKEKPCIFITDMKELIGIIKEDREWSDVLI